LFSTFSHEEISQWNIDVVVTKVGSNGTTDYTSDPDNLNEGLPTDVTPYPLTWDNADHTLTIESQSDDQTVVGRAKIQVECMLPVSYLESISFVNTIDFYPATVYPPLAPTNLVAA
jgi:hypothetical protein